jgi:membrane protease YdiL (CAAX protease family)
MMVALTIVRGAFMTTGTDSDKSPGNNDTRLHQKGQIIEVSVFLFLIVPSLIISFFIVKQGSMSFKLIAVSSILRDLALVSLILFFLWRNGEPLERIGWRYKNARTEIALGILLFIPFSLGAGLLDKGLRMVGFTAPATPLPSVIAEKNTTEFLLAVVLVIVVALAEETIFRGYLILRFQNIMANTAAAVLTSAVIFSLGHGYEGSAGVITIGVMGVVFAIIYLWRQSLVAPMVMHFLQDFIGIVLAPLLGIR